jgi:hypothetical protein
MERELHFTIHALKKMARKHVKVEDIRYVLGNPERTRVDPKVVIVWGRVGRRRLKIVVTRDEPVFVITIAVPGEGG